MKKLLLVVGAIAVAGFLYACGGSSSSSSGGSGSGITTTVAAPAISTQTAVTSTNAAKTVNSSKALASSLASGSMFPNLGSMVSKPVGDQTANGHRIISTVRDIQQKVAVVLEKHQSLGKQVAAVSSPTCPDGGTMSYDTAMNPLVVTFSGCKMNNEYLNGTMSLPQGLFDGSATSGTLTANLTTISYAVGGYSTKINESALNMTMSVSSYVKSTGVSKLSINGTESSIDYTSGTSDKQSFGNFSLDMTESATTTSMTLNGSVSMDTFKDTKFTTIDTASGMTFQTLALVETTNTSSTALTIDGTFAIKTIPSCNDGTFTISTQSPITTTSGGVTTGQMTVNGVVMVFNADGTVTATINGTPQTIASYANACSLSF